MRSLRSALLVLIAAVCACLLGAAPALAKTVTIDAVDTNAPAFQPPNVTIDVGDTVRWEFDQAVATHTVTSSSSNWTFDESRDPNGEPVEKTFDTAGTYTFLCKLHPGMEGSVTVQEAANTLDKVLVFSKTAGFRHDSIPQGIQMIQELGSANGFAVDATEDGAAFTDANLAQYDVVVFLSTTGDVLDDDQQAAFERYIEAGHGYVGIHAATDTEYTWPWYGQMLGAYFRNHPAGTPQATVHIEDTDEPSTTGAPDPWTRTDEWYNFQPPTNPVVNGGGNDYSPRDSGVHVLATVDESTYGEDDGNSTDDDHPVTWCTDFDGGRAWYTAMGHTQASYTEQAFRDHVLGGIRTAAQVVNADCGEPRQAPPSANDFEITTLDDDTESPMELAVAKDGRVFYVERITGELNVIKPDGSVLTAGVIPVSSVQENGLLGIALDPNFDVNHNLFVAYTPLPNSSDETRIARFTLNGDTLDMASERVILVYHNQRDECCHSSGSLAFDGDGNLYMSTGDNTNPFASDGFDPIDERDGRDYWDAQRTAANSNSYSGKILRITPLPDPTGPGVGTGYTIPNGNLFNEADDTDNKTLPEIFAMGFRNPFRITIDPISGKVLMGDYGPDASSTNPDRGPQGSVEYNIVTPGFYGWPYCIRDNVPYNDYNFETGASGPKFDCDAPVNNSPHNTGLTNLPPAIPAVAWMGYSETDPRNPGLGTGGAPTGGPRYHYDPDLDSETKFPAYYDGQWFIGEWNNGWIKTATLNANTTALTNVSNTPWMNTFHRPHELEFGPDGSLYVIDWGTGFNGNNLDSGIYRIDYVEGARKPVAHASADPSDGPTPLTVQFSSAGSVDPEGTSLTYAWDFDGDGTTDSTDANPSHTYNAAGNYNVRLTVTDQAGMNGTDTLVVVAGNTRPTVTLEIPEDGQFADFGDKVAYKITVTDPEDGTIDCDDVTLSIQLGHDEHAHGLGAQQGCEGTFTTLSDSGHDPSMNIFTSIVATYTDKGNGDAQALTGMDDVVLHTRRKRAEFFTGMGRLESSTATGDPGVQTEDADDAGGGHDIGYIENGDYIAFDRMNFENLTSIDFRVASAGAGGKIELRMDDPNGPTFASADVTPTGGWQNWTTISTPLSDVPEGTHTLYIVFTNPTDTGSLMNLNWFQVHGKGAAVSSPADVSATATPDTGQAPLEVSFDATATDPEGEALTYAWDFGVTGTNEDKSDEEDPTYTYQNPGTYTATVTVTDEQGIKSRATVAVRVTRAPSQCDQNGTVVDDFDGSDLAAPWEVVRRDQTLTVSGGALHIPAQSGDVYGTDMNNAKNLVVRDAPDGAWTATAKIAFEGNATYHQAGVILYGDDDNFVKFGRLATDETGAEKFEFIAEVDGTPRNEAADSTANVADDFPKDYFLRMTSDGTQVTGEYSTDGDTWTPVGRAAAIPADAKVGIFAFNNSATTAPVADFDWFRIDGSGVGTPSASRDDDFEGDSLDKSRWNAIVRDNPSAYSVSGGNLTITTELGDIYTADTTPPPNNFILQSADHAGEDWVIETKLSGTISDGYAQGGLMAHVSGDEYVKFDAISDTGNDVINRLELRSEVGAVVQDPQPQVDVPAGTTDIWLRLTKAGTTYTGQYSFDGETWQDMEDAVENAMTAPSIGLFAFGPQAAGVGDTVSFDYFTIDGQDEPGACECTGPGDEFDEASLDTTKWNAIVRPDDTKVAIDGGQLKITTVPGDIYEDGDSSGTRNFLLQSADHVGKEDYVLETAVDVTQLNGGYAQGGILVRTDDDNYIKFDALSDQNQTAVNRIELRSEVGGSIQNPQPQANVPAGTTKVWLRLTKTGSTYMGEYSFDGTTWTALSDTVTNEQTNAPFGLFTLGVNNTASLVVGFDYFSVDGSTGCPPQEPENNAPEISEASASPASGFAPLDVDFDVTASDDDDDELTYSWDFDGDGTEDSTTEDPSHTYDTAGSYNAKVTVSDGDATATKTIPVQVLAADDDSKRFRVLVFSKTTGFRHSSIPDGIAAVEQLGADNDFQVDATEDATLFRDGVLSHYDAVVFMSTTGDPLNDDQQAAFERYIQGGGGYVGVHAAADSEYTWTWYGKLVGGYFRNHPAGTPTATVHIEDTDNHSTEGLPNPWERVDEWYNYQAPEGASVGGGGDDYSPREGGVHVLATVDESTYDEDDGNTTDDDHPISWCHRYDGGRAWYTGMGHTSESFSEAPYLKHLLGGIEIAAGAVEDADCGTVEGNHAPTVSAQRNPSSDVNPGDPVAFTAQGSDADGDELTYAWDFGDGATADTKDAMHAYTDVGVFYAKVTVSDGKGGQDSALLQVTVQPLGDNEEEVGVGGVVPGVLSLEISGSANFGAFQPGVARDYTASLAAKATSTASSAVLTVRDPSSQSTGHLVNGTHALESPVQIRATDDANPDTVFAPLSETGERLNLLAFPTAFSEHPMTIDFKQSISASEALVTGGYGKTVVFTLSPTTP